MTLGLSLHVALERAGTLVSGRLRSTPFSVTDGAIGGDESAPAVFHFTLPASAGPAIGP